MAIGYDGARRLFKLDTTNTTYMIALSPEGYMGHVYYGRRIYGEGDTRLLRMEEEPNTPSVNEGEKASFMDFFPMEYPTGGVSDYRESCLEVRASSGGPGCELLYADHKIYKGKKKLAGLPASFGTEDETETLDLYCEDGVLGLKVILSYAVFEKENVIARSVRAENSGGETLRLEKVYSACIDMDNEDYEMLTLCGSWARERHIQTRSLAYGKQSVASAKGESSHQQHPFMALVSPGCTQEQGEAYAMHFVYSGNFLAQTELTQFDAVRMVMGISPEGFCWVLRPGEVFQAPEVILTYSDRGLGQMTRSYHDFYRNHLIRSPYRDRKRPILINNWEATYFAFDTEKLLEIARVAGSAGIEMFVMDDGWFGKRNEPKGSLGDWVVNEEKLKGGLSCLVEQINALGMDFGIWFEPEMISPDSDLYRAHPDWAIRLPGRTPVQSRNQYVLDLSRPDVREYVYESVAAILRSANITYVKWDMNRQLSDLGSAWLAADSQGELSHRFVLGLYELQEKLVTEFPDLLLENCSSGGGRFDPGMLYYSPQIWCSDDTDAIERLVIQEGTALVYPLSAIGAHVSACPNHMLKRSTPFETRGHVALAGTFGYELDVTKLDHEELAMIPVQVELYHKYNDLIRSGDYYRIASYRENHSHDCWAVAAKDGSEVLLTWVQVFARPNVHSRRVRLQGFDPKSRYRLEGTGQIYSGEMLLYGGFLMENLQGDYQSRLLHFVRV